MNLGDCRSLNLKEKTHFYVIELKSKANLKIQKSLDLYLVHNAENHKFEAIESTGPHTKDTISPKATVSAQFNDYKCIKVWSTN